MLETSPSWTPAGVGVPVAAIIAGAAAHAAAVSRNLRLEGVFILNSGVGGIQSQVPLNIENIMALSPK